MKNLFETVSIGNLKLKNRIARSATFEMGGAEDGLIQPLLSKVYEDLVKGGVGLIITGLMGIGNDSQVSPDMTRIDKDEFVSRFSEIARRVHEADSKIVIQLAHGGVKATVLNTTEIPYGPSDGEKSKALTREQIGNIVKEFGRAATRAKEAGADGVQLHAAHGYLISEFLSPYFNKRKDEYGGSIENRARLLFDAYDEVRNAVGDDYPVLVKINYSDLVEESSTPDECLWVCKELEKRGIDAIEVSCGISVSRTSVPTQRMEEDDPEGFFANGAKAVAEAVSVPVFSVGGFRTPEAIDALLNSSDVAGVSMSRPFIAEPNLINRWKSGDRSKSICISCNKCFREKEHGCAVFG